MLRLGLSAVVCGLGFLVGCSSGSLVNLNQTEAAQALSGGAQLTGTVHGGQQAISGAHVYVLQAGITGYAGNGIAAATANKSVSLLTTGSGSDSVGEYVLTDSSGNFAISSGATADYACVAGTQIYLYALGGNSGGGANSAAGLLAALGACPGTGKFPTTQFVFMNEVTTVAAAYAMAGFATDATHVSSSGSALAQTGIANAFSSAKNLADTTTGAALATTPVANGGNGTVPQTEINTLANILAACINSTGPTFTTCTTLFSNAKNGSLAPTDTATAAINIAHNPGANIGNLFALQVAGAPFQSALTTAPNDFTIAVTYTAASLNGPDGIAIDAAGNVWVANATSSPGAITRLNPTGAATGFTGGGLNGPAGVAIDTAGQVWIGNGGNNTLSLFGSTGTPNGSSPFSGGGLNGPDEIAFDAAGHLWIADNFGSNVSEFSSTGTAVSSTGYSVGGLNGPAGVAMDISGHVWITNSNTDNLSELNTSDGTAVSSTGYTGGGLSSTQGLAIDASGNVLIANGTSTLSEFSSGGVANPTPFSGGGLNDPVGVAIDGAGNIWVGNGSANGLSEFTSTGAAVTGANGYLASGLVDPAIVVIDGSGNVWTANVPSNTVVQFVGASAPVVTPAVANLLAPYGSHAVNKP